MLNALTIDVEDYFHVSAFARTVPAAAWEACESRVGANTRRLLEILGRFDVRGTFFALGWVAERHPDLVWEILEAGHEIGCHSYGHRLIYEQSPREFRADLVRCRDLLEDLAGTSITLYRAPSFSITRTSWWAFEVLVEEGFDLDASVFPIRHDRYGIPDANPKPHRVETPAGSLREFPAAVCRLAGINLPVSGGGYFRLLPARVTDLCLRRINEREGRPFAFYLHPWEVDPDQPRLPGPWRSRFRHYQNLRSTRAKLEWLLPRFEWGTITEAFEAYEESRTRAGAPATKSSPAFR